MKMLNIEAHTIVIVACSALVGGCDFERPVSQTEMRQAMDEVVLTGEAQSLEDDIIEITTNFTIGEGVAAIAREVREFAQSQIPCSTVTSPEPGSLVIDFGDLNDGCEYRGRTFAGVVAVQWEQTDEAVLVTHSYQGVTNGRVTLDGDALVTWNDRTRRVETDLRFTGENATVEVQGDRTQTPLGGIGDGIRVDGERQWTGPAGSWDLDIDGVEFRPVDPVPQAGSYTLTTPADKVVSLSFERVDEDTIAVTMTGPRRERVFHVTRAGNVKDMS